MDQRVRVDLRARIRRIHEELKNTTIYVTHDQAEAITICDRLLILHEGDLQQIGTVDEVWNHPANKFVAHFVGEPGMNFIPGKFRAPGQVSIQTHHGERTFEFTGEFDPGYVGSEVTVGVRPQQMRMVPAEGKATIAAEVKVVEFRGERTILTLELADINKTRVKVDVPASVKKQKGETCWLEFAPEIIHLFNGQGKAIITRGR
jgi:ABC-type sugar transport system ATPase subunit